jgi:biofilm PGA synthesis N-glycosyltransferase PgaC
VASLVFLVASAFVVFTLVGYPALLWVLARRKRGPVTQTDSKPLSVTVLLPVHNGEQWIAQKLTSILAMNYPRELLRVIVLSDASTDRTNEITEGFAPAGIEIVRLPKRGKATALNSGLELASGDIVFFTDVRQPLEADCLRHLTDAFCDPAVGAVCGELIIIDGDTHEEASVGLYWRLEKWIRRQLSGMGTLLVVTGCVYAIRRKLAKPLPGDALGDDIFMPQAILAQGYRVVFADKARAYDYPTNLNVEFNRKVRTLAGLYQFIRQRGLGSSPFHFFWYKVSRLLLPYALFVLAVCSIFLSGPFAWLVSAVHVMFYSMAALDRFIPERSLLKRISAPARTFCVLMLASLMAARVLFVPPDMLWKRSEIQAKPTSIR